MTAPITSPGTIRPLAALLLFLAAAPVAGAAGLAVEIVPGVPSGVAFVGEDPGYRIVVRNGSAERRTGTVSWTVVDGDGRKDPEPPAVPFDAAPGAEASLPLPLPAAEPGYRAVRAVARWTGGEAAAESALAVVEKPANYGKDDPESFFATMFVHDPEVADRLGIKAARVGPLWGVAEPQPGTFVWDAFDARLAALRAHGIALVLTIRPEQPPRWADWRSLEELTRPEHVETYRAWVAAVVRRYADQVSAIELVNEPDLACADKASGAVPPAATYAALLREGAKVVRSIRPGLPVLGLDVSGVDFPKLAFSRQVLDLEGRSLDLLGGHPYGYARYVGNGLHPESPLKIDAAGRFAAMADLMKAHGLKPRIWSTEFGWALHRDESLGSPAARLFAAYVAQAIILARSVPAVEKLFWFAQTFPGYERGCSYGLFRGESGTSPHVPTPAASAYAACARLLDKAAFVRQFDAGPSCPVVRFRAGDRALFALWIEQPESMGGGATLSLPAELARDAEARTGYGTARPASAPLALDALPAFLSVPAAAGDAVEAFLRKAPPQPRAVLVLTGAHWIDSLHVGVDVANNGVNRRSVKVYPEGGSDRAESAAVPPGASVVRVPLDAVPSGKGSLPLVLLDEATAGRQSLAFAYDLHPLPRDGAPPSPPGTVLATRDAILPADPGIDWKGPDDLSLRFRAGWSDAGVVLDVRVADDVHHGPPPGVADLWSYDSLQVAFDFGNRADDGLDAGCRELLFALGDQGPRAVEFFPDRRDLDPAMAKIERAGGETRYRLVIPWALLRDGPPRPGDVFRMNFIVNDNDGRGRKCWIGPAPGIGEAKRPAAWWQWVVAPAEGGR